MFGWPILLTARASSTNRRTSSGFEAMCGASTLIATRLPMTGWMAGVDRPHPALANLALDAVLADLHPLGQIAGTGGAAAPPVDGRVVRAVVL